MLEPLGTTDLGDPDADREWLHFAASADLRHLYTVQADDTLRAWKLSDALVPTAAGQTALPLELYDACHQFSGSKLVLWGNGELVVVDLAKPEAPRAVAGMELDGLRSCVAVGDQLYVERYLSEADGYGVCALPTEQQPSPPVEMLESIKDMDHGSFGVALGDRLCWATQHGLKLMQLDPPRLGATLKLDSVVAFPLPVSPSRLAVLEIYDEGRSAVVFVDDDGKKLKRVAALAPKHVVRAWCLEGDRLFVVLRSSKKLEGKREFENTLVEIDTKTAEEISSTVLPFVEVYGESRTRVLWLGVKGTTCAVLLASGVLHRFTLR